MFFSAKMAVCDKGIHETKWLHIEWWNLREAIELLEHEDNRGSVGCRGLLSPSTSQDLRLFCRAPSDEAYLQIRGKKKKKLRARLGQEPGSYQWKDSNYENFSAARLVSIPVNWVLFWSDFPNFVQRLRCFRSIYQMNSRHEWICISSKRVSLKKWLHIVVNKWLTLGSPKWVEEDRSGLWSSLCEKDQWFEDLIITLSLWLHRNYLWCM